MPLKRDGDHRWVEMEFLVPGTPEQVWDAVATGPGMSSWFTDTMVEERIDGAIRFDFGGGMASSGVVTGWQPPYRLTYEEIGWAEDAPPLATELTVTARDGGRCVVRMVHSLFTSDDQWDDQIDGFESGWPGFFEILRLYLTKFPGRKAVAIRVSAWSDGDEGHVWRRLTTALGLAGADAGDVRMAPDSAPGFGGQVERIVQTRGSREIMLLLHRPEAAIGWAAAFSWGGRSRAAVSLFLYGDDAREAAAREKPEWEAWITGLFPPAADTPG
jgi:uncharacterized protein YndB with AHSA1/START domain